MNDTTSRVLLVNSILMYQGFVVQDLEPQIRFSCAWSQSDGFWLYTVTFCTCLEILERSAIFAGTGNEHFSFYAGSAHPVPCRLLRSSWYQRLCPYGKRAVEPRCAKAALLDMLTGCWNRVHALKFCGKKWHACAAMGTPAYVDAGPGRSSRSMTSLVTLLATVLRGFGRLLRAEHTRNRRARSLGRRRYVLPSSTFLTQ